MQHVRLGRSGLPVSRLCLGTMTFGVQCDEAESFAIMDHAFEAGITFFDTADGYPQGGNVDTVGQTEEIVGKWMASRRDQIILASKCFMPMSRRRWDRGNSRKHIIDAIDGSLRRLGTDHLDLYQLHADDPDTPLDESLRALDDIVQAGKVRYVGVSNTPAWRIARAIGRAEVLNTVSFTSVQPRYNLLFRAFERDLFPLCEAEGLGVIPYNPLAGGLLTGKHSRTEKLEGRFTMGNEAGERYSERYWHDEEFATLDAIKPLAEEAGITPAHLALGWIMAKPYITSPIVGASRPEQLDDAFRAVEEPLDADLVTQLDALTVQWRRSDAVR